MDGFEVVDIEVNYRKLTVGISIDIAYSSLLACHTMALSDENIKKLAERIITVECGQREKKDTYYYKFKIKTSNGKEVTILKRFHQFKMFREDLKQAYISGEEKFKVTGEDGANQLCEGHHIIPVLDEAITPATDEQAQERHRALRLFLLKVLSHQALSDSKVTEKFLSTNEAGNSGYINQVKQKAGRIFSFMSGKLNSETEHMMQYIKGSGIAYEPSAELKALKDNASSLQTSIINYTGMIKAAIEDAAKSTLPDIDLLVSMAKDIELQIEAIIDSEKALLEKKVIKQCIEKGIRPDNSDVKKGIDTQSLDNIKIWTHNSQVFLKSEKEKMIETIDKDLSVLEQIGIKLMAKLTSFK